MTVGRFFWRRPSRTDHLRAVACPWLVWRGYEALTFFGRVVTHTRKEAEAFNRRFDSLNNHEMIHLYQARATHDSWLCFYVLYIYYWLSALRYLRQVRNAGYVLNPFEMEAYSHMHQPEYLRGHQAATEWRLYARMPLKERLQIVSTLFPGFVG